MTRLNIKNIENVEGKYHLMFYEGKNMIEETKNNLHFAWFALLLVLAMLLLFVVLSGFNFYYAGFGLVFLVAFLSVYICLKRTKRRAEKQCIYAVQNSKTTDIVARQVDNRRASKLIVDSMSSTIDKYDAKEKFPTFTQKLKRRHRHNHIVGIINQFEKENEKQKNNGL